MRREVADFRWNLQRAALFCDRLVRSAIVRHYTDKSSARVGITGGIYYESITSALVTTLRWNVCPTPRNKFPLMADAWKFARLSIHWPSSAPFFFCVYSCPFSISVETFADDKIWKVGERDSCNERLMKDWWNGVISVKSDYWKDLQCALYDVNYYPSRKLKIKHLNF